MPPYADVPPVFSFFSSRITLLPASARRTEPVSPPPPDPTTMTSASKSHVAGGSTGSMGAAAASNAALALSFAPPVSSGDLAAGAHAASALPAAVATVAVAAALKKLRRLSACLVSSCMMFLLGRTDAPSLGRCLHDTGAATW